MKTAAKDCCALNVLACALFCAGGEVSCVVLVTNTGNATLLSPTVVGQPAACAGVTQLAPEAAVNCTVIRSVNQAAFDAWDELQTAVLIDVTVEAQTGVNSDVPSVNGSFSTEVALQSRQGVTVTVSASPSTITAAGATRFYCSVQRGCCAFH